jgi:hypothetical protein
VDLAWYAAYGSNLGRARFTCYVEGGAAPGARRANHGCRDAAPPRDVRPVTIPHRLYFAGASRTWGGGGVAFLDPTPDPAAGTLGRAWLLTAGQLADVLAQENGRPPPGPDIALDRLAAEGSLTLGPGPYEHLLHCGDIEGIPVVTFTCARLLPPAAPGPAYTEIVTAGLAESHSLSAEEARRYLDGSITALP